MLIDATFARHMRVFSLAVIGHQVSGLLVQFQASSSSWLFWQWLLMLILLIVLAALWPLMGVRSHCE
jgi:hypothetical protein